MKKLILTLAAVAAAANLSADSRSDEILRALRAKVDALGNYRVEFSLEVAGQTLKGNYVVSGESYRLSTPGTEVYCDGNVRYEVNLTDREILVDRIDPADRTILGNPTGLFDFLDGSYTHRHLGKTMVNGVSADEIELISDNEKLRAFVGTASGLPVRIAYRLEAIGTDAVVDILSITPNVAVDKSDFAFDRARYAGFETIDFR